MPATIPDMAKAYREGFPCGAARRGSRTAQRGRARHGPAPLDPSPPFAPHATDSKTTIG